MTPCIVFQSADLVPSRPVDRQRVLEAAERRSQAQASRGCKGEVRLPRSHDEGPEFGGGNEGGLRWQVG